MEESLPNIRRADVLQCFKMNIINPRRTRTMARIRIIEPKAVSFATTIAVPMHKGILIPANKDIYHWEKTFIGLRDTATNATDKRDFDRCRATIKWAYSCNASLEKVTNSADAYGKTVEFTFAFATIENLNEFVNNLRVNVGGATI